MRIKTLKERRELKLHIARLIYIRELNSVSYELETVWDRDHVETSDAGKSHRRRSPKRSFDVLLASSVAQQQKETVRLQSFTDVFNNQRQPVASVVAVRDVLEIAGHRNYYRVSRPDGVDDSKYHTGRSLFQQARYFASKFPSLISIFVVAYFSSLNQDHSVFSSNTILIMYFITKFKRITILIIYIIKAI